MLGMNPGHQSAARRSFLPEDYIERRTESRTNMFAVSLFAIVAFCVVAAFLVTSRRWHDVKQQQEQINVRYAQAAKDIEQLKELESKREALLQKAELTTALIERVPRSILLAELINRMPLDTTLLELEVKSTRIADEPPPEPKGAKKGAKKDAKSSKNDSKTARRSKDGSAESDEPKPVISAPRFKTSVMLIGVASTHNSVAHFVAELQKCPLLREVELKFSEKAVIEERELNRFRIECQIKQEADARRIEPLAAPRLSTEALGRALADGDESDASIDVEAPAETPAAEEGKP